MRKLVDNILALTPMVCIFLLVGFAGSLELNECTLWEYIVRSAVTLAILWVDVKLLSRRIKGDRNDKRR